MGRGVRIWEAAKTVLIFLLLCSLVAMSVTLISELVTGRGLPQRLGEALGWIAPELPYVQNRETYPAAATPLAISMTGANGRGSTVGDPERTAALYESFSRHLGEALATASMPVALDLESWQLLLSGESISFLFPGEIPLASLTQWLGATPAEGLAELSASHLTLCIDGERVALLMPMDSGESVSWLCLSTAMQPAYLRQALERCRPDGSLFAIEDATLARIDPLSLLTVNTTLAQIQGENPLADGDQIEAAAELLGLNPYRDTAYTSANGTVSFTAGVGRLRVTSNGVLHYQAAAVDASEDTGDTELIETARQLLAQLSEGLSGGASLQLSGFQRKDQTATVRFDYVLDGFLVHQRSGSAAEFVFENGVLRELTWVARRYTATGQTQTLLPARQAAAIVSEGSRLEPVYMDSGAGVGCGWLP